MSKSRFDRFWTIFSDEFLWRDDEVIDIDEERLKELFKRYFKSGEYPSFDELRSTVRCVELVWDDSLEEYLERSVSSPKEFDQFLDVFEDNLAKSFRTALDTCGKATPRKVTREEKPIPDDREQLVQEHRKLQQRLQKLKNEEGELSKKSREILSHFPKLKRVLVDPRIEGHQESTPGTVEVRIYNPNSYSIQISVETPPEGMTGEERSADGVLARLSIEWSYKYRAMQQLKRRLAVVTASAVIQGIHLEDATNRETPEAKAIEKRPRSKEGQEQIARFPSPKDLKWEEVSMTFVSNETLEIRARGVVKKYHYAQIGFQDKRKVDAPNMLWLLLKDAIASEYGEIAWERSNLDLKFTRQAQKKISRLRGQLREIMGIEGDPFCEYRKVRAYRPKFSITHRTPVSQSSRASTHQEAAEEMDEDWKQIYEGQIAPRDPAIK